MSDVTPASEALLEALRIELDAALAEYGTGCLAFDRESDPDVPRRQYVGFARSAVRSILDRAFAIGRDIEPIWVIVGAGGDILNYETSQADADERVRICNALGPRGPYKAVRLWRSAAG